MLKIALVNNMPAPAREATLAQFSSLLRAGAQGAPFALRCYALPSARQGEARLGIARAQTEEDISALYSRGADILLVTGAQPCAQELTQEPYWEEFAQLVDWARLNTRASLWSCLAAHGAVLRLDGLARRREARKISGVFVCEVSGDDWATQGDAHALHTPHSRYNGLARADLENCGYHISSWSPAIGVDSFWRREPSLFWCTQGHHEYDADTLSREFRRDVLRYVRGEITEFPPTPRNYFSPAIRSGVEKLKGLASGARCMQVYERLNALLEQETPERYWRMDAERLYRRFLAAAGI